MNRDAFSQIAHRYHRIAAPVGPAQVRALLARLSPPPGSRVVDLGCGWGAWLVELLELRPDLTAIGVDVVLPAAAHSDAEARGVGERITWVEADAAGYEGDAVDTVFCIGASHAFGGLDGTLDAVRRHLRPGGQVLLGDTIWDVSPSAAAQEALGTGSDDFPDLAGLVARAAARGFEPGYGHVSTLEEWDDYEWAWTGALAEWALREAPTPDDRDEALAVARRHREAWLTGYRGQLGFATVVLNDLR